MAHVSMRRVSTLMLMFLSLMFPSVGEKNAIFAEPTAMWRVSHEDPQ